MKKGNIIIAVSFLIFIATIAYGRSNLTTSFKQALNVVTVVATADANGTTSDLQGYKDITFYALLGNSGDTLDANNTIQLEVETSADDSTWTDATDACLSSSVTGANTGTFALINAADEDQTIATTEYVCGARYVRPVVNVTGTHSNGTPISIMTLKGGYRNLPVSN